jgi:SAM-dependent methyltransferase
MGEYTTRVERAFIRRVLSDRPGGLDILDVGGGDGRHASLVRELGHRPIVIERVYAPISLLLDKHDGIPVLQGDGLALPVRSGVFDVVLTIEVPVCTSRDNLAYFPEAARVLRDGGLFIFTAFNKWSYVSFLRLFKKNAPAYEEYYYTEGVPDYRRKLDAAGFDIIACRGFRWPPFNRVSNSPLIGLTALLESTLMLQHIPYLSPWLFIAAVKRS